MSSFGIFMFIFGVCLLLSGLYIYTGHDVRALFWRVYFQNLSKDEWKNIGKWTMICSLIPFIISILGFIVNI